jgi:hypothetical protein
VKKVWEFYGTPEETPNTLAALPRGRFRGPPSAGCQGDEEIAKNFRKRFVLAIVGIILDDWRLEVAPRDRAGFVTFEKPLLTRCEYWAVDCSTRALRLGSSTHFSEAQGNV